MTAVFALSKLFDDVSARFADEHTNVQNVFGWREPEKRTGAMRVVWVPGDDKGDAGKIAPPRNPGGNPRSLGTLLESFTVYCEGVDASQPENERAQYEAARAVYDTWFRAVYLAAHGTYTVEKTEWLIDKKERRYGATIRVVCTVQAKIPDTASAVMPADATAIIGMELDDSVG